MSQENHATVVVSLTEFYYGVVEEKTDDVIRLKLANGDTVSVDLDRVVAGYDVTINLDDDNDVINIDKLK